MWKSLTSRISHIPKRPHPTQQYMHIGAGMAEVISFFKLARVEFTMEITSSAGRTKLEKV